MQLRTCLTFRVTQICSSFSHLLRLENRCLSRGPLSAKYVNDVVARSVRFYQETFGFSVLSEFGERGCAMHAGPHQVLLLFKKGASRGIQSPHDGDGELHLAFAIPAVELADWESWLSSEGIV